MTQGTTPQLRHLGTQGQAVPGGGEASAKALPWERDWNAEGTEGGGRGWCTVKGRVFGKTAAVSHREGCSPIHGPPRAQRHHPLGSSNACCTASDLTYRDWIGLQVQPQRPARCLADGWHSHMLVEQVNAVADSEKDHR